VEEPGKVRRRELRRLEDAVRGVLLAWDPIPGAPDDEYDCLIWPLVRYLDEGAVRSEIAAWLQSEVATHYGIEVEQEQALDVARRLQAVEPGHRG
jgi:hypothetical protein